MANTSRTKSGFRLSQFRVMRAALGLLLLALAAPAAAAPVDDIPPPDLGECQELAVQAGNRLVLHAFGVGVQIYRWNGTSWVFVAPQAILYADAESDAIVAIHFGGPTWEGIDGSEVVGAVIESCTPDPTAIPWLLLEAVFTQGPGVFDRVSYIQRLNTVGGKAPAVPGDFPGQVASVPYTADYSSTGRTTNRLRDARSTPAGSSAGADRANDRHVADRGLAPTPPACAGS